VFYRNVVPDKQLNKPLKTFSYWIINMPKENIPINKQEAQLMLTNPRDAVRRQPRSPYIVDN